MIILTLVLKAAHLPDEVTNLALPIVYSVDFINARVRSAVNVMGICKWKSYWMREPRQFKPRPQ